MSFLRGVGRGWGPAWSGYLFKRTVPEVMPLFEKAKALYMENCPGLKYTQHPYCKFVWPGGEFLTLRHMLDVDDYADLHGSQVTQILFEELTNWATPEVYLRCMSLLRSSHPEASQLMQVWSSTNPGQVGHGWVKKRWQLPEMTNKIIYDNTDPEELSRWSNDPLVNVAPRPRIAIFIDVRKNHAFMKANPTYLADLAREAPNESTRRAWIDGSWDIVSGGMFDSNWDRKHHVVKPFPIPKSWKLDRSHDAGSSTPFCVLWYAESDGSDYVDATGAWRSSVSGDIFVIREWYGTNGQTNTGLRLTPQEISKGIIERELEWNIYDRVIDGPADNAIHAETISGINVAAMMAEPVRLDNGEEYPGVTWTRSDKNSGGGTRKTGWNLINQYLKNSIPDPQGRAPREKPGLFFFDILKHTLDHFHVTPRDDKDPEDIPKRGEYHIQDTIRYRVLASGGGFTSGGTHGMG